MSGAHKEDDHRQADTPAKGDVSDQRLQRLQQAAKDAALERLVKDGRQE
jgi:hypothetical protein